MKMLSMAIVQAQANLLRQQNADGYWQFAVTDSVTSSAEHIMLLSWLGLDDPAIPHLKDYILSRQLRETLASLPEMVRNDEAFLTCTNDTDRYEWTS